MKAASLFSRVCCINLARRQDRWDRFLRNIPADWPFPPIERISAIDGEKVPAPDWWSSSSGAWGCYRSHLRVIEAALNDDLESILILEDDALFEDDFTSRMAAFADHLPDDWGMLYLGGQHLKVSSVPPRVVNEHVCVPYNVNRTHAFALRRGTMEAVYRHLSSTRWREGHHIDHHLGQLVEKQDPRFPVYCPRMWLIGQAAGESNIAAASFPDRRWDLISNLELSRRPFFALVGVHDSGIADLATVAGQLGLVLGGVGYNSPAHRTNSPSAIEDPELADICESVVPFLGTKLVRDAESKPLLRHWIKRQLAQTQQSGGITGGMNPLLCGLHEELGSICGDQLRLIVCERPLNQCVQSLRARLPQVAPERVQAHQHWLATNLRCLRQRVPVQHQLVVQYEELLHHPEHEAYRIVQFLDVKIPQLAAQITKAVAPLHLSGWQPASSAL